MARTPLLQSIIRLAKDAFLAERRGTSIEALHDERARAFELRTREGWISRRQFLAGTAAAAASFALPRVSWAAEQPRIVIVGAGLAGLNAALTLSDMGYRSTVYDASGRIGGRMFSHSTKIEGTPQYWLDNQVTEWCGELIDSEHKKMLALAKRFHLDIEDVTKGQPEEADAIYQFGGQYYSGTKAAKDFAAKVWPVLKAEIAVTGDSVDYTFGPHAPATGERPSAKARARALELDAMSVRDWLKKLPGGLDTPLARLLDVAYTTEYGVETTDQSALGIVLEMGDQTTPRDFNIFGTSDERYHIRGGNQQLPIAIAQYLASKDMPVQRSNRLTRIARNADGRYTCVFSGDAGTVSDADHVILALPFAVLRTIDFAEAGFDDLKVLAIKEQGGGKNAKLQVQVDKALWREKGPWSSVGDGTTYSDRGYQCTWAPTNGQIDTATGKAPSHPIVNNFRGGAAAIQEILMGGRAYAKDALGPAQTFLKQLDGVLPGVAATFANKATLSVPHLDPNLGLAYTYYRVGQTTGFAGSEKLRQKNCHFAGEHTSVDYLGFMEGAAESGERAAREILGDQKGTGFLKKITKSAHGE